MGEMVSTIFSSFSEVIEGLSSGIKTAFVNIIYEDPEAATKVLSAPIQFALIFAGVALASGLVMGAFHWIRNRK